MSKFCSHAPRPRPKPTRLAKLVFPASLTVVAIATLSAAAWSLIERGRATTGGFLFAPAASVLLLSAMFQLRAAWSIWQRGANHLIGNALSVRFARVLFLGMFLAYLAALAVGPIAGIGFAWLAVVSLWYSSQLTVLAARGGAIEHWRKWTELHAPRRLNWVVYACVLLLIGAEAGLQTHTLARQRGWFAQSGAAATEARQSILPVSATAPEIGLAQAQLSSGAFRVAVLSAGASNSATSRDDYLARVEEIVPGLEMVPVRLQGAWSNPSAAELAESLAAVQPDLVLAVVPLCEEIAIEPAKKNWFDCRQFELIRLIEKAEPAIADRAGRATSELAADFESYLAALAPQLAACLTPISASVHKRWQRTFVALGDLHEHCRARHVPLAVVLVPGEFQVSGVLFDALVRRTGNTPDKLDLELPQRKMAGFADPRGLPLIDLLPNLRLCSQSPYEHNATAWNERGNAAAASAISGWLESRYGGKFPASARLTSAK